jgi:hypothetical protein
VPARTQSWPVPVDLSDNVYPYSYCCFLKLPVKTSWGSFTLIAIFNEDETAFNANIDFTRVGLDPEKPYRIYEFWD